MFIIHNLYRLRHFLKKIILNKELQENNNYSTIDYIASNYCIAQWTTVYIASTGHAVYALYWYMIQYMNLIITSYELV